MRSGLNHPYATRPLGNERLVFPIRVSQPGIHTFFLRLESSIRLTVDPELWRATDYLAERKHKILFDGICYGILVTLLVYNLVLAVAFRSRAYLFYVLTCASALLTLSTYNGHAAHYLWPETPWLIRQTYTLAPALWLFFAALFARAFLSLRDALPQADRGVLFVFTLLVVLVNWGVLESPFLLANGLQLGVSAEMIVFAVALSARINHVQNEKAELDLRASHLAIAAATDPLTGVANRNGLAHAAERLLQQTGHHALLLVDLDRFKEVNDRHGHEAGDLALVETARRLERHVRASDMIARTGGDEFVILLADRPEHLPMKAMLTRLCDALAEPIHYDGRTLPISASVGVALYPEAGDTLQELQRAADRAMYRAKESGVAFTYAPGDSDYRPV